MGEHIRVRGIVQGVGFRPTVARLARACGLRGWVRNDADGVLIGLSEAPERVSSFIADLLVSLPPLARVDAVERTPALVEAEGFSIEASGAGCPSTGVSPDARMCHACAAEVFDPTNRRFRYPFTTCTRCGPRLTIAAAVPWDRANTTMAAFPLCADCQREYDDEGDRRYHAEPIACLMCGPRPKLLCADGRALLWEALSVRDELDAVALLLQRGQIVAIKGLGGYQLLCDATNPDAVAMLRERKQRPTKAFAVMGRDMSLIRSYAAVSDDEERALTGSAGPIVLLDRLPNTNLALGVAPGQSTVGFLLPTTPLHALVLARMDRPVVCTSGNLTEEPQATDDDDARQRLFAIADGFLVHDRPIANRVDDSVVRRMDGEIRVLRRARGYAPAPIPLPPGFSGAPPVLALGPELKSTIALTVGGNVIVSQHLGDLDDALTFSHWQQTIDLLTTLYRHKPAVLAVDGHKGYRATAFGRHLGRVRELPVEVVSHHHAHIAAVMGDRGWGLGDGLVLGLAYDGLGAGEGDTFWGGEALLCDYRTAERVGTFKPVALIGSDRAAVEPWRNLYAHLRAEMSWAELRLNHSDALILGRLLGKDVDLIEQILPSQPRASSVGRLFDAVAAAVGLCFERQTYEGEAAAALESLVTVEALARAQGEDRYPLTITPKDSGVLSIEPLGMWRAILGDLGVGVAPATIAARFHVALADVTLQWVDQIRTKRPEIRAVALSGGCWQNKVLLELVACGLRERGHLVLVHELLPPNDGCIAFGQALVAAAQSLPPR